MVAKRVTDYFGDRHSLLLGAPHQEVLKFRIEPYRLNG
jgi:hypothetical protein